MRGSGVSEALFDEMANSTRRDRTRARLVQGTAEALERYGLRDFTVEQVIEAAGVSRRTFYVHFPDKDTALRTLYAQVADDIVAQVEAAVTAEPLPQLRLGKAIGVFLDVQVRGGRLIAELQADALTPGSLTWPLRAKTVEALIRITEREVKAALGVSLHRDIYAMLFLGVEGLVLQHRRGDAFTPEARAHVQHIAESLFMHALLGARHLPKEPETEAAKQEG